MKKNNQIILCILVLGIIVIAGCSNSNRETPINNRGNDNEIIVYKTVGCGCCSLYVKYLEKNNLNVKVVEMDDISSIKEKYGVPLALNSCHTTIIDSYFVEGHIPLEAINKLIEEKPDIVGIAMPDMPSGSPGMPGGKSDTFIIYAVNKDGTYNEFMRM